MDCSPPGSSVHGESPGKNTGVGNHALLQGIFPNQGLNPALPHCRWICLSHQGSPLLRKYELTSLLRIYELTSYSSPSSISMGAWFQDCPAPHRPALHHSKILGHPRPLYSTVHYNLCSVSKSSASIDLDVRLAESENAEAEDTDSQLYGIAVVPKI